MKKIHYLCLAAGLTTLASCSSDDFLGGMFSSEKDNGEISFGITSAKVTRDFQHGEAAEKLNNNFILYGFKYYTSEPISATEVIDDTKQQKVFDLYNVNYTEGSANTTESNTAGWEYVGLMSHTGSSNDKEQTIKYWDYESTGYVFSAVSGTGVTAEKIASVAKSADAITDVFASGTLTYNKNAADPDKFDKGWVVTIPQGGSLSDLYASERVEKLKATTDDYINTVSLKFYNMAARVRFGVYEIVPGYSVSIDRFYYNSINSETNFGVDGNFSTLKTTGTSQLIVTYYNAGTLLNHPKVTAHDAESKSFGEFGTNIQTQDAIGIASNDPTYDQNEGLYTDIIPMTGNGLELKVDYTLKSTDNSGETIHVKGATAKVPANFTEWKANFAYTYLFKISDNTNGTTGTVGSDPTGLYPITFDACVVANEDGIQETITEVAATSITTYQMGEVVTAHNEYVAGKDIYFEDGNAIVDGYKVYEVNNLTTNLFETQATMTEEVIANYINNFCVLTEVDVTYAPGTGTDGADPDDFIPLSDNTYIKKSKNKAAKFTPATGKTYVIATQAAGAGTKYKVVKVEGTYSTPAFTLATDELGGTTKAASINAITGTADLYVSEEVAANETNTTGVIGAVPCLNITSTGKNNALKIEPTATAGKYTISVNADSIYAGKANDTYAVKLGSSTVTITVNINTALYANDGTTPLSAASVTAGDATGVTTTLKIADAANANGKIVNSHEKKGVVVTNSGSGNYKITATKNAVPGVYNVTIAGQPVAVTVTNYAFAPTAYTYNMNTNGDLVESATKVVLKMTVGTASAAAATGVSAVTIDKAGLSLSGTDGELTATATAGGTYKLSYQNTAAAATVTVNKYAITGGEITRSTGRLELSVKVNDTDVNASAARVKITKKNETDDLTANFTVTANGKKVVISGAKSTLDTGDYTIHYYLESGKTNEVATSDLEVK